MNDLRQYFEKNNSNLIDKWVHYFDVYELYFHKFRNRPINLLEIGVFQGGSLLMWKNYFHSQSKIFGIDFNSECKKFEQDNINIHIGSQSDKAFLRNFISKIPKFDIIIDDGSHKMNDQIISFEILFDHLNYGGIYVCEDTHTSYWKNYGGGIKKQDSFIEFSKSKIDDLHAWHSRDKNHKMSLYTQNLLSIHFYDSMVVFLKDKVEKPVSRRTGEFIINPGNLMEPKNSFQSDKGFNKPIYYLRKIFKLFK